MRALTQKQEKFCLEVSQGKGISDAYRAAYDTKNITPDAINCKAKELMDNGKITARLAKLNKPLVKEMFSEQGKARMRSYIAKAEESHPLKFVRVGKDDIELEEPKVLWNLTLFEATGTSDLELGTHLFNQAIETNCLQTDDLTAVANETLLSMHGIGPKDTLEGLLTAQMVGAHNLAMTCMKRAMIKDQYPEAIISYAKLADQFCRTFTTQLDSLNKYRGKGQQKVTVEHVHVNAGGQAIVGNINTQREGGS